MLKIHSMKLVFLGTGTSTGVPQPGCKCGVCTSSDPLDSRLRTSALVELEGKHLLIDCGPDFREQMLRFHRFGSLDALLITHQHYDHVGGADDLRPYVPRNGAFPVYCQSEVARDLKMRMPYCFTENPYPGVPHYDIHLIEPFSSFSVCGIDVLPLPINHYKLEIVGFKIGNLAYITDAKFVPEETVNAIQGIDTLVINALRQKEHISHLSLSEALDVVAKVQPRVAYLTHISHDMGHSSLLAEVLPSNVRASYDGLSITIP